MGEAVTARDHRADVGIELSGINAMMTRRRAAFALGATVTGFSAQAAEEGQGRIRLYRVPNNAIQPQVALDDSDVLHLVYYTGDAHHTCDRFDLIRMGWARPSVGFVDRLPE